MARVMDTFTIRTAAMLTERSFYHMAEESYYVWFPSIRNFLAGVIEFYERHRRKGFGGRKELW